MSGQVNLAQASQAAGGKAYTLGRLLAGGFRVPPGYCVFPATECAEIVAAWRALGGGAVAVRSSSGQEDGAIESFAGQFETVLDVGHEPALLEAVAHTQASLQGSGCVIVQRMVAARVAGVFFTRDPTSSEPCARLEAAPGRGDAVVSGRVKPTSWRLHSGAAAELLEGSPCLDSLQIQQLSEVVEKIQHLLGGELDVEFAWDEEMLWILQARPITAGQDLRQQVRAAEIARALSLSHPGGTVWSRYSLAETLPSPLPMTWSVVRRMLSGRGAYGRLYRDLGYDPHPSLDELGVADLICGRPYFNLSREVLLYFQDFPFVHPIEALRADRRLASYPAPQVDLRLAPPGFWGRLPATLWKMVSAHFRLERLRKTFAERLSQQIAPAFLAHMERLRQQDLCGLDASALVARVHQVVGLVVDDFAADSLKASAFAALSMGTLDAGKLSQLHPPAEADLAGLLQHTARGELSLGQLLQAIGHRGVAEMELAEPRWQEVPDRLRREVERLAVRPSGPPVPACPKELELAQLWVGLRERARHWLMFGWAELRRTLLALDERWELKGDIFWLELDELSDPPLQQIARRRQKHRLQLSLPCPAVLFSDDLEAIGRSSPTAGLGQQGLIGTPLSWGVAEGEALVVSEVGQVPDDARNYVLVCPSTDPGYTFAMTRARALVVETGGVLSHGAIVARELGLPAVANIPIGELRSGMRLQVDGEKGEVVILQG